MFSRALARRLPGALRRFPVLGIRDFQLLLADRLLAPAAYAFSLVGVSFAVLHATGSTFDLSLVLAAQILPSLIFTLAGGVIADRVRPQLVIIAGNLMIALGEGTFGILVLTGHPTLWQMIALETMTGTGMAIFYPASQALLPRLVPGGLLQQASAISRMAMNGSQMAGAALAGLAVTAFGPGWALLTCGTGMLGTVPLTLSLRVTAHERVQESSMLRDLREGWSEFRSHTWLWVIVAQFGVILMAWYGSFEVLGPVVALAHLGGAAGWGAITACGVDRPDRRRAGLAQVHAATAHAVRRGDRRGHRALAGVARRALATAAGLPGVAGPRHHDGDHDGPVDRRAGPEHPAAHPGPGLVLRRARSVMAMPAGALVAGPIASVIGVSATQYGAAALIIGVSLLALIPRDIRQMRAVPPTARPASPGPASHGDGRPVPDDVPALDDRPLPAAAGRP